MKLCRRFASFARKKDPNDGFSMSGTGGVKNPIRQGEGDHQEQAGEGARLTQGPGHGRKALVEALLDRTNAKADPRGGLITPRQALEKVLEVRHAWMGTHLLTILCIMVKQYLEEQNLEDTFSLSAIS